MRCLLTAACALLLVHGPLAGQAADVISGTWTGDMGRRGDAVRQPITVELSLAGDALSGTVTGPPRPGTVRTGSYDPASGRIRFEVFLDDGDTAPFVFDGLVVSGTALGSVSSDGVSGEFKIQRQVDGAPGADSGSQTMLPLEFGFRQVNEWLLAATQLVPAEHWAYRPVATVRTLGEVVAHVADSYGWYCGRAAGRAVDWSDAIEKGGGDRSAVLGALENAISSCSTVYANGGDAGMLMANIAHANLHYGNMVTYMRLLGLVPPSS